MVAHIRNGFAVILFVLTRNIEALAPPPLCERVDVGTLSVSPMGFGTLNLPVDKEVDDEAVAVLKTARDCGINFVDTAEAVSFVINWIAIDVSLCRSGLLGWMESDLIHDLLLVDKNYSMDSESPKRS